MGTGIERAVAVDSGVTVIAKRGGVVDYVDASRVVIKVNEEELVSGEAGIDIYNLTRSISAPTKIPVLTSVPA